LSRTPYTPLPLHVLSPVPLLTTNFSPENGDNEEEHTVNAITGRKTKNSIVYWHTTWSSGLFLVLLQLV